MSLPNINISFQAQANSAIQRSSRGVVCLVLDDATAAGTVAVATYTAFGDVPEESYTAASYKAIEDAFLGGAPKVHVVCLNTDETLDDVKASIDALDFDWMCHITETAQSDVVTYIKARNTANPNKQVKAVVYNATSPNDMHIVNFANASVKRIADDAAINGWEYLARITGILAALPFTRSATYYLLDDLESVTEVATPETADEEGNLIIINDYGEPKFGRAVNSLTTIADGMSAAMKKITIVEAMDLMKKDIATTFKNSYVGQYKNNLDNQDTFIAAVNLYFAQLAQEQVLDSSYDNVATLDVEAQRRALIDSGITEAADWDDTSVKQRSVDSRVFLSGNIKILDAMEDLTFVITVV